MITSIRQVAQQSKVAHFVGLPLVESLIPPSVVREVLTECDAWEKQEKKLNMPSIVYFLIALALFPHCSLREVWRRLVSGWQQVWPDEKLDIPTTSALCQRKKQLGVLPMRRVFERCCRPVAQAATRGAFRFGLRVVAMDGTRDQAPDTDANRCVFRYSTDDPVSHSPFPQVRCVLLLECGTHVIFDAELTSCRDHEQYAAEHLIRRSVGPGMLLLQDIGLYSHQLLYLALQQGAQVLTRITRQALPHRWVPLCDGTYLTKVPTFAKWGCGHLMTARVIEYTVTHPDLPGYGETHRLVTTLLCPVRYPAMELIKLYHERWEIETGIDEYKTHLRLSARTLRSQTPEGVEQELYGIFLAHYLVRALMHLGALQEEIDPDLLSFTHTLSVLQRTLPWFAIQPDREHPALRRRILAMVVEERLPKRRLRFQARVVKRTRSRYERKTYEHLHAPSFDQPFHHFVRLF